MAREAKNKQYEGSAINNIAVTYLTLAEYETSASYLAQALALQTEAGNRRGQGVVYNNLGTAYLMLGDADRSEGYYRQALAIRREVKDERGEGFALNNLGQVFLESGEWVKARDLLEQALVLRKRIADKQGEAVTERNLGKLLFKQKPDSEAVPHLERANKLANEIGDRRVEADSFYWLASINARSGEFSKGIEFIEKGLGIIEQIRGEIINPQLRTSYFSTVPQYYELYADLLISRGRKQNDEKDIELALQWRGSSNGDDLADVCFDRVLRKIGEGEQIENVAAYAATVAQFVYKESLRSKERVTDSLDADDARDVAAAGEAPSEDPRMACLDRCLGEFQADDRKLVVAYYDTEEKTMIASRKRLADSLTMSINTLRIKVCRLKAKLEKCTKDCCKNG